MINLLTRIISVLYLVNTLSKIAGVNPPPQQVILIVFLIFYIFDLWDF